VQAGPSPQADSLFVIFQPHINPSSPSLRRIVPRTLEFANVITLMGLPAPGEASEYLAIDSRAMMRAIVEDGLSGPKGLSTSNWLIEWLRTKDFDPASILGDHPEAAAHRQRLVEHGAPVTLAPALGERVLPRAVEIARETVGKEVADLRHILFALLEEPAEEYGPMAVALEGGGLDELRRWLIRKIGVSHERGEKMAKWRALIARPPPGGR